MRALVSNPKTLLLRGSVLDEAEALVRSRASALEKPFQQYDKGFRV